MLKKLDFHENRVLITKTIIASAIIGGLLSTLISLWINIGSLNFYLLRAYIMNSTLDQLITEPIIGIIIGAILGALIAFYTPRDKSIEYDSMLNNGIAHDKGEHSHDNISKLALREEQLNIYKKWIKTGEVSVHKEFITEEKNITVPIIREELVIEKKVLNPETASEKEGSVDIIRIPISEERIDISKHKVILEDVNIYKHQFQQNKHIEETLKKEKLTVKTTGDPEVTYKDSENTDKHISD